MNQNNSEGVRKPVLYAVWLIILLAIGGIIAVKSWNRPKPAPETAENADASPEAHSHRRRL